MVKINLGCGLQCPDGWINIDNSMGVRISRIPILKTILYFIIPASWKILPNKEWKSNATWMNITKKISYNDNFADCIYSSHTFEHLSYEDAAFVFSESFRIMKSKGIIRIIVPDFEAILNSYLSNKQVSPSEACYVFHKDSGYFEIPVPDTLFGILIFYFKRKNNHRFLYDEMALKKQFENAGFINIQRKKFRESNIACISEIDIESRFANAICMEAEKP